MTLLDDIDLSPVPLRSIGGPRPLVLPHWTPGELPPAKAVEACPDDDSPEYAEDLGLVLSSRGGPRDVEPARLSPAGIARAYAEGHREEGE